MTTQAELEAAIDRAPDDPAAYLVYADWLQQHGDPRGQLIALQHAGKDEDADSLFDDHLDDWWGPLADALDLTDRGDARLGPPTKWRCGFLESLWIANKFERSPMHDGSKPEVDIAALLGAMLDHPTARFLRTLTVGIVDYESNDYEAVIAAIANRPRPLLHTLGLGDFYSEETELNWSHIGAIAPLCPAARELRSLTLRSGTMQLAGIDFPNLESFTVISGGLGGESARAVADAEWPALHTLSLQLGREKIRFDDVAGILAGARFPKLRHLGFGNASISDDVAIRLAEAPIAGQLESLDFSDGTLGDDGAAALAAAKPRFKNLKSIDVSSCYLTDDGLASLRTLCDVVSSEQRKDGGDPENRYINAYE